MAKNLTVEQKLEILKAHGVNAELYSRAAYKVLNYQNIFDIFTIGNAIGRCTMEVSESYAFDKDCLGYIYIYIYILYALMNHGIVMGYRV